ncbi:hypothetical protein V9K21_001499 [Vibrio cholerae]|nr:hypothetical protein [Vibrio cholerae]
MAKDLTASSHERQNILNNRYALQQAEQHLGLGGVNFEGETVFTKAQVVAWYDVTDRTIERYLSSHADELKSNGYQMLKGKKLKEFKGLISGADINDGTKTTALGLFSFRAVLNIGMLLTESEPARLLRSRLLGMV